jgi:hypothetical protein
MGGIIWSSCVLSGFILGGIQARCAAASLTIRRLGVVFTVYVHLVFSLSAQCVRHYGRWGINTGGFPSGLILCVGCMANLARVWEKPPWWWLRFKEPGVCLLGYVLVGSYKKMMINENKWPQ